MDHLGTRIRSTRERIGLTARELASRAGMAYSTLMDIENGRSRRSLNLHRIAEVLGVSALFLETGRDESHTERTTAARLGSLRIEGRGVGETRGEYVTLSLLDLQIDAAQLSRSAAQIEAKAGQIQFRRDFVEARGWTIHTHFVAIAPSEAMAPTIEAGAQVVVDISQKSIESGRVHALVVDDDIVLARLDKLGNGRVRVRHDNPSPVYASSEVQEADLRIVGRAVWTSSSL